MVFFGGIGITIQGVWFKNNTQGDGLDVWYNSFVKLQQSVLDLRNNSGGIATSMVFGGTVGSEVSGIKMHNATIGGFAGTLCIDGGRVDDGDWTLSDAAINSFIVEPTSSAQYNSINMVGGIFNINVEQNSAVNFICLLGSYNAVIGVLIGKGSRVTIDSDNVQVNGADWGFIFNDGSQFTLDTGAIYFSQINNCSVAAVVLEDGSAMKLQNTAPFLFDNTPIAIEAQSASQFVIQADISYGDGVGIRRAFDATSTYSATNSTETPSNVLTHFTSEPLDSVVPTQMVTNAGTVITLDPSSSVDSPPVFLYIGKRYNLKAINNGGNSFTLSLVAPAVFIGAGVPPGINSTITINGVTPFDGAGVDFTVVNATTVMINAIVNGVVSLAIRETVPVAPANKVVNKPKIDLTKVPARYQKSLRKALKM